MSVGDIHQLSEKRKKWVEANRENDFEDGIKRLLTDLYPDNAHFIYELLQNAEDAEASEVQFILNTDSVEFEHNGSRLFSIRDVESITSIGVTTKKDDPTSIGKFGVGFKAVFDYTSTPEIKSGEYHFRIHDLVVPDTKGLSPRSLDENRTHFLFPFDNSQKSPEKACAEIEKNLRQLDEGALLFLKNLRKIEYLLPDSELGFLERVEKDGDRIEISVKHPETLAPDAFHYLRFEKVIEVNDEDEGKRKSCRIAVAFGMESSKERGWRIKPLDKGQICIYFPAEKETSNLRFHLHAPFASTVARDSVRDCPANDGLRDHLADLVAESMFAVRDQGMLNVEFLATLPNDRDNLSSFYQPIQEQLVKVFQDEKLTPMKCGGHAAASGIYRGSRRLSELINDEDLATILGKKDPSLPLWAANAPQQNQEADNFLSLLKISKWNEEDLVSELSDQPDLIKTWLKGKSDEWHQEFYALLGDFLSNTSLNYLYSYRKDKLSNLSIVRLSDGATYKKGEDCYFPSDDVEHDEEFPRVAKGIYSSGKNENQQKKARQFLEKIGVREVEEIDRVQAILRQRYVRYVKGSFREENHERDIERFIALIEKDHDQADLFRDFYIFKIDLNNKTWWEKPSMVFLDSPYLNTGLSAYYKAFGEHQGGKWVLSPAYQKYGIDPERLGKFAEAVGAQIKLEVKEQKIPDSHPEYRYLMSVSGERYRNEKDIDYTIPAFKTLLDNIDIDKARLVWQTMDSLDDSYLEASYRRNKSGGFHHGGSSLVHDLRKAEWVPQRNGESPRFVRPCGASIDNLPEGFTYDKGKKWLEEIRFGEAAKKKSDDHNSLTRTVKKIGFDNLDDAKKWAEIKKRGISPDEVLSKLMSSPEFPTSSVSNPERRQARLAKQLDDAPEKEYEQRQRSVRTTQGEIDPSTYLKNRYTNDDDQIICQICKDEMPFKKRDGEYYFEAVEALSKAYFPKENEAQFLALCPECAARYKEFVKNDEDAMDKLRCALQNSDDLEIALQLRDLDTSLRFVETHRQDIRTILDSTTAVMI